MIVLERNIVCDDEQADLKLYLWENSEEYKNNETKPMMIICPGGGYSKLSDREGQAVALQYCAMGYHAAVLKYSLAPVHYPVQLHQLAAAVALCRENAEKWYIDPDRISVTGFSAGGNLVGMFGTCWHKPELASAIGKTPELIRPDALILCYAVLLAGERTHLGSWRNLLGENYESRWQELSPVNCVSEQTPPCFLWHTGEDATVPVDSSIEFACALHKHFVPFDLHIYQTGPHGMALCNQLTDSAKKPRVNEAAAQWITQAHLWLKQLWNLPY